MAAQTRLAKLYNDRSVLENHHACRAFELLEIPENNILSTLSTSDWRDVRRCIISTILSTDMAHHFELTTKFSAQVDAKKVFEREQVDDRQILSNVILHAADISNVAKPWMSSKLWSDRVFEEFLNQGDVERENGLPISPYMDRNNSDRVKMTVNFIGSIFLFFLLASDFLVMPLFAALKKFDAGTEEFLNNIHKNRAKWVDFKESPNLPKPSGRFELDKTVMLIHSIQVAGTSETSAASPRDSFSSTCKQADREQEKRRGTSNRGHGNGFHDKPTTYQEKQQLLIDEPTTSNTSHQISIPTTTKVTFFKSWTLYVLVSYKQEKYSQECLHKQERSIPYSNRSGHPDHRHSLTQFDR